MNIHVALLFLASMLASAQVAYINDSFVCSESDARYCAGGSLATNIIIRCSGTAGQPGNCNDNLAGIPPVGVKSFAPCYQSSPTAGDAACSFDGTVYPEDDSEPFPVPSGGTHSSYGGSMTTLISQYTTGTITNTYTVTVPCSTTTATPASSAHEPSATTVSSCYFNCPTSSATPHEPSSTAPPTSEHQPTYSPPPATTVPSETHPPPVPPLPSSEETSVTTATPSPSTPTFLPPSLSTSISIEGPLPSVPPPTPASSSPSTLTSTIIVQPTPAPSTSAPPAPPAGTGVGIPTTSTRVPVFTGAAAAFGKSGDSYGNFLADVAVGVVAIVVVAVVG